MSFRQSRDALALASVVVRYYVSVAFQVRRELRRWRRCAQDICDPMLRITAVDKLGGEYLNTEAAAAFATLAPRRCRRALVELLVAFEVMYDYLDGVSESDAPDPLANGLRLHQALVAAILPQGSPVDYYAGHRCPGDGGYLDALVESCRRSFAKLPAAEVVRPIALAAAERCGQGQSRTHAVGSTGVASFRSWAESLGVSSAYKWSEVAAGAASSLAMHALFASAADRRTTRADAVRTEEAYFPAVCALSTLLDSLIDYESDLDTSDHSYVAYYDTPKVVADRLGFVARDADRAVRALRRPGRHAVIATGVSGFYLSAVQTGTLGRSAGPAVIAGLSPALIRPVLALAGLKRRF